MEPLELQMMPVIIGHTLLKDNSMHKIFQFILVGLLLISNAVVGQDVIVLTDATKIEAKKITVNGDSVFFHRFDPQDTVEYRLNQQQIKQINYQNGRQLTFGNEQRNSTSNGAPEGYAIVYQNGRRQFVKNKPIRIPVHFNYNYLSLGLGTANPVGSYSAERHNGFKDLGFATNGTILNIEGFLQTSRGFGFSASFGRFNNEVDNKSFAERLYVSPGQQMTVTTEGWLNHYLVIGPNFSIITKPVIIDYFLRLG